MWKIPLSDIDFDNKEINAVVSVLESRWFTMGAITEDFEKLFAGFLGVKHAIAVSSCTSGLHLSNMALGIGMGDEVICPSFTFVAGANSILHAGAVPVFADIKSSLDLTISPDDIEKKIGRNTRAIQVMHYSGSSCAMDEIIKIAKKREISIIEDCAHAPGSKYGRKMCGTIGDVGCFSFFSNKNMVTGEGGMVVTNNTSIAKKIRLLRSHGMTKLTMDRHRGHAFSYDVVGLGYNYRIDEMRSAIGIVQLEKLEKNNLRRRKIAGLYRENFAKLEGVELPQESSRGTSSNHLFPILLKDGATRRRFMERMKIMGIQTSIHYPPIHKFDFYKRKFGNRMMPLPVTEDVAARIVTLPLYPTMNNKEVQYVCYGIDRFFNKGKGS